MNVVGREIEEKNLLSAYESEDSELVAVYGRRRVGKTYLIEKTFNDRFAFRHTGLSPIELMELREKQKSKTTLRLQLEHFYHSLKLFGMVENKIPKDWLEAFFMLERLLQQKMEPGEKLVVFIDELPWLDTKKSLFITSFEAFWNGWANGKNILVIVCGSAISWMTNELINNHGGLYGRVTKEIRLEPMSLHDCEQLLENRHVRLSRYDIVQAYMIFGGIPYYLNQLKGDLSLAQNVDAVFFGRNSTLQNEYLRLFAATFDDDALARETVEILAQTRIGLARDDLAKRVGIRDGERFAKVLDALLTSSFIVKYKPLYPAGRTVFYRLVDPFCLFYLTFVLKQGRADEHYFSSNINAPALIAWRGLAFENVCYFHVDQIKKALGIEGVVTNRYSFLFKGDEENQPAQIDMVLERADNIVHLCEMKYLGDLYQGTNATHLSLVRKESALRTSIKKKQAIRKVLITTYGIMDNGYRWDYENVITLDDLFAA